MEGLFGPMHLFVAIAFIGGIYVIVRVVKTALK